MLAGQATDLQPTSDEWELIRIDLLTEKECAEVLSVVHDLIGYKSRTRLGAASYKGLPLVGKQINKYLYHRRAMKLNPIFRERLGWLYDRLAKTLAHALGAPTRYPDDLALPGFHVNQKPIREKTGRFPLGAAPPFRSAVAEDRLGRPEQGGLQATLVLHLGGGAPCKGWRVEDVGHSL